MILISKTDLVSQSDIDKLTAVLKTLNTDATIVPISNGNIETNKILNTGLFDLHEQKAQVGLRNARRTYTETEEYGIGSFVYEARRPFYPQKFLTFCTAITFQENSLDLKGFSG